MPKNLATRLLRPRCWRLTLSRGGRCDVEQWDCACLRLRLRLQVEQWMYTS